MSDGNVALEDGAEVLVLHIVVTDPLPRLLDMSLADALVSYFISDGFIRWLVALTVSPRLGTTATTRVPGLRIRERPRE